MMAGAVLSKLMETMARSAKLRTAVPRRVAARMVAARTAATRTAATRIGGDVQEMGERIKLVSHSLLLASSTSQHCHIVLRVHFAGKEHSEDGEEEGIVVVVVMVMAAVGDSDGGCVDG
jgi:cation transporter-like permease